MFAICVSAPAAAAASITYNEDMSYAFGAPITDGLDPFSAASYSRGDKLLSETVLKYWTNFIKTGYVNHNNCISLFPKLTIVEFLLCKQLRMYMIVISLRELKILQLLKYREEIHGTP